MAKGHEQEHLLRRGHPRVPTPLHARLHHAHALGVALRHARVPVRRVAVHVPGELVEGHDQSDRVGRGRVRPGVEVASLRRGQGGAEAMRDGVVDPLLHLAGPVSGWEPLALVVFLRCVVGVGARTREMRAWGRTDRRTERLGRIRRRWFFTRRRCGSGALSCTHIDVSVEPELEHILVGRHRRYGCVVVGGRHDADDRRRLCGGRGVCVGSLLFASVKLVEL